MTRPGWTPSSALPAHVVTDFEVVGSRLKAEGIVKHQRQDHCSQRLVEVRCRERGTSWDCAWRIATRDGRSVIQKHNPDGLSVIC